VKYFSCWQQFVTLLYAQIGKKDSLRDITTSLRAQHRRWYHLGLKNISRSTLADANTTRSYAIYEELFYDLLGRCRDLTPKHRFRFKNPLHSIDATTIDLCLSAFPWARYRKTKGALKLHFLYDHAGCLPSFMVMTEGRAADIRVAKDYEFSGRLLPDSIVSVDRAYIDWKWFESLDKQGISYVTRLKKNMTPFVIGQQTAKRSKGVLKDEKVIAANFFTSGGYRGDLRVITYKDPDSGKIYRFLTNNFKLAAATIAAIYKARWQIELFFKWIKQNLKIKSFLGTSKNAVLTQVWTAMCAYLLLAYIKYQTKFRHSLLELGRLIRETLLSPISLLDLLSLDTASLYRVKNTDDPQLAFF